MDLIFICFYLYGNWYLFILVLLMVAYFSVIFLIFFVWRGFYAVFILFLFIYLIFFFLVYRA